MESEWKRAASFGMRAATAALNLAGQWSFAATARTSGALAVLTLFLGAAAMPPMDATVLSGAGQLVQDSNLPQAAGGRATWWRDEQIRQRAVKQASWAPSADGAGEREQRTGVLQANGRDGFDKWRSQTMIKGIMRQQRIEKAVQEKDSEQGVVSIAALNVQAMPVHGHDMGNLEALIEAAKRRRWQAVMVADLHADAPSVVNFNSWLLVHGHQTVVLLALRLSRRWRLEGSRSSHTLAGFRVFIGRFCMYHSHENPYRQKNYLAN